MVYIYTPVGNTAVGFQETWRWALQTMSAEALCSNVFITSKTNKNEQAI